MRFLKLTIAYDGTAYAGWQVQPNGRTIQEMMERALLKITGESMRVIASGRTDAGVHALGQVVSFETESELSPEVFVRALNAETPFDITVLDAVEAPPGFHAIRDARRKRYRYFYQDGRIADPFGERSAWFIPHRLDAEAMHRAAQALVGKHDFTSYASVKAEVRTRVRTIYELTIERQPTCLLDRVVLEVEANGFLYNMVRNIAGVLLEVGRGAQPESWPGEVLAAMDRRAGAATAPPQGLFLVKVDY
ncbi:tRNA pseudouridine(38-40) synthase TruA [Lignipirellula cremea]|uniref:tRNA pseudouridine synthase A n=1 Tax=Lignipirellula cremea TaxID=2528010 RepID=A0A518E1Q9_9BACT|nr:tRNA pseudouridine(38-40) synthase TruA [Lignipirellula cremea]QDU98037.1 tRNA pseudouridine synthase A [Lignipirellula cremea]